MVHSVYAAKKWLDLEIHNWVRQATYRPQSLEHLRGSSESNADGKLKVGMEEPGLALYPVEISSEAEIHAVRLRLYGFGHFFH